MRKPAGAALTRIDDIIQMIELLNDHLMDLHRLAEDALIAETTTDEALLVALALPCPTDPVTVN